MSHLFARDAGLPHIVVIKLPHTTDMGYDAGEDPDSPVCQARAWCAEQVATDAWNLRYTPETCYVRFARETDAVLLIVAVGGSYRRQPTPRTTQTPRDTPLAKARLALAARAKARDEAAWVRRTKARP